MRAEIEQRYLRLAQEASGEVPEELPPPPLPTEPTSLDHFQRWIDAEAVKVSVRTGRVLSRDIIHSHNQLKKELARFQAAAEYEVHLTAINPEFYELFRNYALGSAERSPRTFNGYLKQLRQFLFWCEEQEVPVSPRFRRVLRLVPGYVGVEALSPMCYTLIHP